MREFVLRGHRTRPPKMLAAGPRTEAGMNKDLSWEDAIQSVLRAANGAMHYTDIAEQISAQKVRKVGANPAASVSAILSLSLQNEDSPFQKVGRGQYTLKSNLRAEAPVNLEIDGDGEELHTGALRAFGMFWLREGVIWSGKPKILGKQGFGASEVNFAEQVGVYLLHDRERVIYVGRADEAMFTRLRAHTTDRLGGRWDRFSWFGLRSVTPDATLSEPAVAWTHTSVIETLEALLIESLEPPLNRKRGDNFSGAEYIQVIDPEIQKLTKRRILTEMLRSEGLEP